MQVVNSLVLADTGDTGSVDRFIQLLDQLASADQRKTIYALIRALTPRFLATVPDVDLSQNSRVSAVAGLLSAIIAGNRSRTEHLKTWLLGSSSAGLGDGVAVRRAVVAAVCADKTSWASIQDLTDAVDKMLAEFGDSMYIKHVPVLQQEGENESYIILY